MYSLGFCLHVDILIIVNRCYIPISWPYLYIKFIAGKLDQKNKSYDTE